MTLCRRSRIWHYCAQSVLILLAQTLLAACNSPVPSPTTASLSTPSSAPTVQAEAIANAQRDPTAHFVNPQLAFDKSGALHLTYGVQSDQGSKLFHQQKTADGSWS